MESVKDSGAADCSRVRANGFGNDVGLEVLEPGFCGADGGAAMAARGYGAPDHGIFRLEVFRERILQLGNDTSFVHDGSLADV